MPRGAYDSADARCPFFKKVVLKEKELCCAGIFDRSWLKHRFRRNKDLQLQYRLFCCADYKCCEIYRAIMEVQFPDEM